MSWSDQPKKLEGVPVLLSLQVKSRVAEVRKVDGCYALTIGDLWGSQTIECVTADVLLMCLNVFAHASPEDPPKELPRGCALMS